MAFLLPIKTCFKSFIFILIILPIKVIAQEGFLNSQQAIAELYRVGERYYSLNDEFINGFVYPVPNTRILGDPYLNKTEWSEGILFINRKSYSQLSVKYDLIIDDLIIKVKTDQNMERLIAVNKSQIDSFIIHTSLFLNSRILFPDKIQNTFYEKISDGKLAVYNHYEKNFIDLYSSSSPFGKFSSQKSNTYLFDNNELIYINNKKSFLDCFKKSEQEKIRKYLKVNKINYNKISSSQMAELISYCATIISM